MTDSRILTEYIETAGTGTPPSSRLNTLAIEAASGGTPPNSQLGTLAIEAATGGTPPKSQLNTLAVEVASTGSLARLLGSAYVEVLSPRVPRIQLKNRESGAWVVRTAVAKYWNGSAWITKTPKYWNGTAWVDLLN